MDFMDQHDMWDDTLLMVITDHGFLLSEHDWWGKGRMPWYNETAHIPLFLWDPRARKAGVRRGSITQTIDVGPTLLNYFGINTPDDMQGRDLLGIETDDTPVRDAAIYGMFGAHVNLTDGRYVYMRAPDGSNEPLHQYTLMPTHMRTPFTARELSGMKWHEGFSFTKGCPVMQIPAMSRDVEHLFNTMLFDLESDPGQLNPIRNEEVEKRLESRLKDALEWNDAPAEQLERLGLGS